MKTDSSAPERANRRTGLSWTKKAGIYGFLILGAILLLLPLVWMVSTSLKPEREVFAYPPQLLPSAWEFENYKEVFSTAPFARQYWNSIYIGTLNVAGTLIVASLAGYSFARLRFPFKNLVFITFLAALLLPAEVVIVPQYGLMARLGWIGTQLPLIIEPIFGAPTVVGTFLMRQYFLTLPSELEDAGKIDGLGRFGVFWHIALPLAKPALATAAVLTFLASWNAFLQPLVFTGGDAELWTVPVALNQFIDFDGTPFFTVQMAATTLSVIPVAIVFTLAQRFIIAGISQSGIN